MHYAQQFTVYNQMKRGTSVGLSDFLHFEKIKLIKQIRNATIM